MTGDFPAPQVQGRPATPDEVPKAAQAFAGKAREAGWSVEMTYSRGTPMDAYGNPKRSTTKVELRNDDGSLQTTPTGRPRTAQVDAGPKVVDVLAVRCYKVDAGGDVTCVAAFWQDGAFDTAAVNRPWARLTAAQARARLTA